MTLSSRKSSALALSVDHLSKRFGDRTAFDNVSFAVGHGEVFGFLGPNGAGKTTTVRTLGTLIAPTSGSAMVAGLALTPESPGLYLRLTVTGNLECFAGLYGLSDSRKRIDRTLHAVNLERRANDPCGALSKGLRQRVSLARALLSDADVLFTPLLALFSIWVGIAISARSRDVRVAQQLGATHRSPHTAGGVPHRVQRDPRDAWPGPRRRGGTADPRWTRLAARVRGVRPRTAHYRYQVMWIDDIISGLNRYRDRCTTD